MKRRVSTDDLLKHYFEHEVRRVNIPSIPGVPTPHRTGHPVLFRLAFSVGLSLFAGFLLMNIRNTGAIETAAAEFCTLHRIDILIPEGLGVLRENFQKTFKEEP